MMSDGRWWISAVSTQTRRFVEKVKYPLCVLLIGVFCLFCNLCRSLTFWKRKSTSIKHLNTMFMFFSYTHFDIDWRSQKQTKMICGCMRQKVCAAYAPRTTDTRGSHITHQNQPIIKKKICRQNGEIGRKKNILLFDERNEDLARVP